MRAILAVAFLCLVWTAADAREIMTNDGRVLVTPDVLALQSKAHKSRIAVRRAAHRSADRPRRTVQTWASGAAPLITEARRWLGSTARQMGLHRVTLWCATALDKWLRAVGLRGTGSDLAMSYAHWGRPAPGPALGVIAVMRRRGGGHVGIVTQVLGHGRIRVISGNHSHRVREAIYSTRRVIAWRVP